MVGRFLGLWFDGGFGETSVVVVVCSELDLELRLGCLGLVWLCCLVCGWVLLLGCSGFGWWFWWVWLAGFGVYRCLRFSVGLGCYVAYFGLH